MLDLTLTEVKYMYHNSHAVLADYFLSFSVGMHIHVHVYPYCKYIRTCVHVQCVDSSPIPHLSCTCIHMHLSSSFIFSLLYRSKAPQRVSSTLL